MIRLFKVSIPSSVIALLVSETILIFSCYALIAFFALDVAADIFLIDDGGWWHIALVVVVIVFGLYFHDLYDNYRVRSRILLIQQFCLVLGIAFLLQAMLSYGRSDILLPKWLMVYGSIAVIVVLPTWRFVFTTVVMKAVGSQRLLFLGTSPAVREMIACLSERTELGMMPIGYVDSGDDIPESIGDVRHSGRIDDLDEIVAQQKPERIVVGMKERRNRLPVEDLLELRFAGIHIEEAAVTFEAVFGRVSTPDLRPSQLIFSSELGPRHVSVAIQSLYSLVIAIIGIILAAPVMVIVAILVKFSSPGPVLFRQARVGLDGRVFNVFKFRSMYQDAEARTGAVWATKDDPRITPLGRWLRKLRLDELPQLFNVLRGDMSIVGPRPERPEFVTVLQEKIPYYRQRHCVSRGSLDGRRSIISTATRSKTWFSSSSTISTTSRIWPFHSTPTSCFTP